MLKKSVLVFLLSQSLQAMQSSEEFLNALITHYEQKTELPQSFLQGRLEATEVQAKFVSHLTLEMGPQVGYKAALTNVAAQEKFGASEPIRGILLEKMLLETGASVARKCGSVPLLEGDLIVRVGSDKINEASNQLEVWAALDAMIPFIELPDLVYAKLSQLNINGIVAINLGARLGVKGEVCLLSGSQETLESLDKIHVEIVDDSGKVVAFGYGRALLKHPINAVMWLRDSMLRQNKRLKKGDLLSLGALTQMVPIPKTSKITARYSGIPGMEETTVTVQFTE